MQSSSIDITMKDKTKFLLKKQNEKTFYFQNISNLEEEKIDYIWSRDPALIKQYTKVVDENYEDELLLKDVYKKISKTDFVSYYRLIVCRNKNKIVGGFRMVSNNPAIETSLPSEREEFTYAGLFPELDLLNNRSCELSRFAIAKEYRANKDYYVDAFTSSKQKMTENNIKYLFLCGSKAMLRSHKREAGKLFKYIDTRNHDVSGWEDFKHLEFYVSAYENPDV